MDPSIVGSLDNVYKDEPGTFMKEDPFKKVPMMDDHEKPSSMMAMEKSVDAMVALVEHMPGSPVPDDATSLDKALRHPSNQITSTPEHLPDVLGESEVAEVPAIPLVGARRPVGFLEEASSGGELAPASKPVDLTKGPGLTLTAPT